MSEHASGTPRRLPDADRQSRGRDAACAVGAADGGPRGLRGHPPDAQAARPPRGGGEARLVPRAQRAQARRRAGFGNERREDGRARVRLRHAARLRPGLRARPRLRRCGPRGRGAARPVRRARPRWSRLGLPPDRWRFAGFLPRKKNELRKVLEEPGGTLVAFESPNRLPTTLEVLAEIDPKREAAVCRELTKAHEEVVRGTAAELRDRFDGGAEGRGRPGGRPRGGRPRGRSAGGDRGSAPAGGRGREAARGRQGGGRPHRRERQRALRRRRRRLTPHRADFTTETVV